MIPTKALTVAFASAATMIFGVKKKGRNMLSEKNHDEMVRITETLNSEGCLCTGFEFNGYVFEIVRKDFYLEQHYKKIPFPEKK